MINRICLIFVVLVLASCATAPQPMTPTVLTAEQKAEQDRAVKEIMEAESKKEEEKRKELVDSVNAEFIAYMNNNTVLKNKSTIFTTIEELYNICKGKYDFLSSKTNFTSDDFKEAINYNVVTRSAISELNSRSNNSSNDKIAVRSANLFSEERKKFFYDFVDLDKAFFVLCQTKVNEAFHSDVAAFMKFYETTYKRKFPANAFEEDFTMQDIMDYSGRFYNDYKNNSIKKDAFYMIYQGEVIQSLDEGFLVSINSQLENKQYIFFVNSKIFFNEGTKFSREKPLIMQADGLFKYNSLTGPRTIYNFRLINLENKYNLLFTTDVLLLYFISQPNKITNFE